MFFTNQLKVSLRRVVILKIETVVRPGSYTRVADGWVPKLAPGATPGPLMQSIVLNYTDGALDPAGSRGMFVTLSDAQHCYFLTGKNLTFYLYIRPI